MRNNFRTVLYAEAVRSIIVKAYKVYGMKEQQGVEKEVDTT